MSTFELGPVCPATSCQCPEVGVGGVFVSITELQTGPLEMKESEWSQSKTNPAGDHYPTDSSI